MSHSMTTFQRVTAMNTAFGNPAGDYYSLDVARVKRQCANIFDEYLELLRAFGLEKCDAEDLRQAHANCIGELMDDGTIDLIEARDALCDIQVFALGGQHMLGVDGDADMHAVVDGVMTRFIKNDNDLAATVQYHASRGVDGVYFEGYFPEMVMKSAYDQPDAPKGKFLKSASYRNTIFPEVRKKLKASAFDYGYDYESVARNDGFQCGGIYASIAGCAKHDAVLT